MSSPTQQYMNQSEEFICNLHIHEHVLEKLHIRALTRACEYRTSWKQLNL